jgi:glutamyl-tRNA reductase
MTISNVGFSHKSASVPVREGLARLPVAGVLEGLRREGWGEAVVLSTCNRFELFLAGAGRPRQAVDFLQQQTGLSLDEHALLRQGPAAVTHLFEVSAGLDSLIIGETEILGQVKSAYETALANGSTGKSLNVLFQRALHVGKKVRSETGIAVGQTSVASVAVQLAESIFGGLCERRALVLGAGAMAELTARHLLGKKVAQLTISNRTFEKAAVLAEKLEAGALPWKDFPEALGLADIVIASTGSQRPVVTREMVAAALKARAGRSLFMIDIAMPRDVEDSVHELDQAYLYRLEDLEGIAAENLRGRAAEVERARGLVHGKAREFSAWLDSALSGREVSLRHSRPAL